ncbi:MAG: hypothetical protein Q4B51_07465 [Coriobacteriaceae bacterium]|nr:hypothetical protein [Coriobacteriaceae bacterium]
MTKTQKLDRNRPEAIVIGSRGVNAVGLIRSLGEAGYAVTFASTSDTIESRWTSRYLHLPESEEEQIWSLSSFCDRLSVKPTIFPTDDQTCLMLDRFQGPLGTRAFCPGARGGLSTLNNKYEMAKLASKCGLLLPETEAINLKCQESCSIPLPVIIKPLSVKDGAKATSVFAEETKISRCVSKSCVSVDATKR